MLHSALLPPCRNLHTAWLGLVGHDILKRNDDECLDDWRVCVSLRDCQFPEKRTMMKAKSNSSRVLQTEEGTDSGALVFVQSDLEIDISSP